MKEEIKGKYLFTCESIIDANEYQKMAKVFPRMYWNNVITGTILNLIFSLLILIISKSLVIVIVFLIIYQIYVMILYKVKSEYFAENHLRPYKKRIRLILKFIANFMKIIL